ncbi:MAG: DUF4007 family protein [Candidatus Helarchaeota archaeon]
MSVSFSATFPIKLHQLSRAIISYKEKPNMTLEEKISTFGVGKNAVEGLTNVLKKSYLLEKSKKINISKLGNLILDHDPYLNDLGTKWIIHYNLSSDFSKNGAEVWAYLINKFIPKNKKFHLAEAKRAALNQSYSSFNFKGISADVGLCLKALTDEEAFSDLKILEKTNKSSFKVRTPDKIPILIFAYILYDWRIKTNILTPTMNIKRILIEDGNVGKIFLLDRNRLMKTLRALQSENLITIIQSGDYDSIGFIFQGNHYDLLEKYYISLKTYL